MQYAAHLPTLPPTRRLVAPVIALVVGAAAATGTYALVDNGASVQPTKVIVVDRPAPGSAQIPGKNEAATAAAISPKTAGAAEIPGKNEAATAAAVGSKPSTSSLAGTSSQTFDGIQRAKRHPIPPSLH